MTSVRQPKKETWQEFFAEVLAETGGPPTAAERRESRKRMGLPAISKRQREKRAGVSSSTSRMSVKTAYEKIAISLPTRAAEHVRRAVRTGQAKSASAYIADAIEERAKTETLEEMLDRMLVESGGPMTTAEARWADRQLGFGPSRASTRKTKKR